jgi:hypothetical protein
MDYKASVYDPSENKIGDVTDLMIDNNGNVTAAIIGVGGFLGVGQKDVVIPFKELKVSARDGKDRFVLNRTKEELKLAPAYNNTGSPAAGLLLRKGTDPSDRLESWASD